MKFSKEKLIALLLIPLFSTLFITQGEPFVRSDGFYYFHTAKSIVDKGNFITDEKPLYWEHGGYATSEIDGKYISVASPGTALLNVPALFISKILSNLVDLNNEYYIAYNGHTILDGLLLIVNALIFFFISIVLIYKTLRNLGLSKKISVISLSLSTISSYILFYVFLLPIFTHVYEVFCVSFLIFSIERFSQTRRNRFLIFAYISSGLLFLIRPVYLPVILYVLIFSFEEAKQIRKRILSLIALVPFALIYLLYNLISYGSIISSGYFQARSESFSFDSFNGLNILFSIHKGWFVYSPLFILSFIGLYLLYKSRPRLVKFLLAVFFTTVLIYSFWPNWWGGGSYGSRFLLFAFPICTLGLAVFIKEILKLKNNFLRISILMLMLILTLYSALLSLFFRVTPTVEEFNTPLYYFEHQINVANSSSNLIHFVNKNIENIQGGSGILAILTARLDDLIKVNVEDDVMTLELIRSPSVGENLKYVVKGFIVDKQDKVVYESEILLNGENIVIDCRIDGCRSNENVIITKVSSEQEFEIDKYMGIVLNEKYDFYIESHKDVQLRGEIKNWNFGDKYYTLL